MISNTFVVEIMMVLDVAVRNESKHTKAPVYQGDFSNASVKKTQPYYKTLHYSNTVIK